LRISSFNKNIKTKNEKRKIKNKKITKLNKVTIKEKKKLNFSIRRCGE
jgi:phosphotransferase system HPr-like phosphotransfer protein